MKASEAKLGDVVRWLEDTVRIVDIVAEEEGTLHLTFVGSRGHESSFRYDPDEELNTRSDTSETLL